MPRMVNNSARLVHLPDAMMVPGQPVDVSDEDMARPLVKAMVEAGEIVPAPEEEADKPKPKPHASDQKPGR